MAGQLQPLADLFQIVDANGRPTPYFIQWAQQRQLDIASAITAEQAAQLIIDYLNSHPLQEGLGIGLTNSGKIPAGVQISAKVQEILDSISSTQGTVLFRGAADWQALAPGTSGHFLKTNGAGADPEWAAGGGGGGGSGGSYSAVLVARKTADQSIVTGAWRDVTWNIETFDSANIFTAGASDFTVPAGSFFMEVNVRVNWQNTGTSGRYIQLYNVTTATVEAIEIRAALNETGQTMNTGIIPVTPGHVYRIQANSGANTLNLSGTGYGGPSVLDVRFLAAVSGLISGVGSGSYTLVNQAGAPITSGATWTWSANVPNVDVVGLGAYKDFLIVCRGVSASVNGLRCIQVSTNNGASFFSTSGDYVQVTTTGTETAGTFLALHATFATAARTFTAELSGFGVSGGPKMARSSSGEDRLFVASTSPVNALRFTNSAGGNLTAGSLFVYAR